MAKYVCDVCGYEYDPAVGDPENGIAAGTEFEQLPEDWVCPLCGVGKDQFSEEQVDRNFLEIKNCEHAVTVCSQFFYPVKPKKDNIRFYTSLAGRSEAYA